MHHTGRFTSHPMEDALEVSPPAFKKPPTEVKNEPMITDTMDKLANHYATEADAIERAGLEEGKARKRRNIRNPVK